MRHRTFWMPFVGVFVVVCGLTAAGIGYYSSERAAVWTSQQAELKAIAVMKADAIATWRTERLQDARLNASGLVRVLAPSLAGGVDDGSQRADLLANLKLIQTYESYQNVILARPDGSFMLASAPGAPDVGGQERPLIERAIAAGDAVFGELFRCHRCNKVHVDVVAPILDGQGHAVAALILRTDPNVDLFPLVRLWPAPDTTAETLLVTKDGDDALVLSVPGNELARALTIRLPLARLDVPEVQAALGRTGGFEGRDYRGREVVAELLPVVRSPWVLVSKIDEAELLAEFHAQRWWLLACFGLAMLLVASLGLLVHGRRDRRIRNDLRRAEREQRQAADEAARVIDASELRYRRLFEAARDGILILDADSGAIVDVNPYLLELTGSSRGDLLGKHLWEIGTFKDIAASEEAFAQIQATEYIRYDDLPLKTKDNRKIAVEFVSNVYLVDGHKVIQCNIRDVSARKAADETLRQSEERFRVLFEHAADCILLLEVPPDGVPVIRDANRAAIRVLGYEWEELIGQPITFLDEAPDAVIERRVERIGSAGTAVFEVTHRGKDGTNRQFEVSGKQIVNGTKTFIISVERDVTERKQMEAQRQGREETLRASQKLESIGTLASGVAHEINNPLNVILNYGQLILDEPTVSARVKEFAENIVNESDRVAVIVSNLLSFARQERETFSPGLVVDIVERTLSLMRAVLRKEQITVQCEIPDGLPAVRCRSRQLQQVLMNLLTNARDALNERYPGAGGGKTIRIAASRFEKGGIGWVRLTVGDNGGGIPAGIADRIFDPFFTTKGRDKGTGLGLSISYAIVREHQGTISFETAPDKGTEFHVDLRVNGESQADPAAS